MNFYEIMLLARCMTALKTPVKVRTDWIANFSIFGTQCGCAAQKNQSFQ